MHVRLAGQLHAAIVELRAANEGTTSWSARRRTRDAYPHAIAHFLRFHRWQAFASSRQGHAKIDVIPELSLWLSGARLEFRSVAVARNQRARAAPFVDGWLGIDALQHGRVRMDGTNGRLELMGPT